MKRYWTSLGATLVLLQFAGTPLRAGNHELKTLEEAARVVRELPGDPRKCISPALFHDAVGVAIFPHIIKAGVVIDERYGQGVVLMHEPDGRWSNPVFVTLKGGGFGGVVGFESTELVLVFKTQRSLDRALKNEFRLGGDIAVAVGPVGREGERDVEKWRKAEIYSYAHTRGLFAGVSMEGAVLRMDVHANEGFYKLHGGRAEDVFAHHAAAIPAVEALRGELANRCLLPSPRRGGNEKH